MSEKMKIIRSLQSKQQNAVKSNKMKRKITRENDDSDNEVKAPAKKQKRNYNHSEASMGSYNVTSNHNSVIYWKNLAITRQIALRAAAQKHSALCKIVVELTNRNTELLHMVKQSYKFHRYNQAELSDTVVISDDSIEMDQEN